MMPSLTRAADKKKLNDLFGFTQYFEWNICEASKWENLSEYACANSRLRSS